MTASQPSAEQPAGEPGDTAEAVARLERTTRELRERCPWDREQDERSIVPHTIEEAYELADAAASGDDEKLVDELGDVLFQVHFLALLLEERGAGSLAEVADAINAKLIRRHPHIYGEAEAADSDAVLGNWDRIKREREGKAGVFEDIPEVLPGLLWARKHQRRAINRAGKDADLGVVGGTDSRAPLEAIARRAGELSELTARVPDAGPDADPDDRSALERSLGELLFAVVDLARRTKVDPELAVRAATTRFRERTGGGGSGAPD